MNEEEMMHCPYNFSHVILKSRMANHLQKCREQFPLENYTTCPFNATHDVPVPELKYHTDTCPDRKTMENYLYVMDDKKEEEKLNLGEVHAVGLEENWDEEKIPGSYLQTKNIAKQKVLKVPVGRSRSEKEAFSLREVEKFQKDEELKLEKIKAGPPQFVKGTSEKESESPDTELAMAKLSLEDDGFREVLRKSRKSGLSRGSIIRDRHLKRDNV